MVFFPFSKCLLVSNSLPLCALKVRLLECGIVEKWIFYQENVYCNLKKINTDMKIKEVKFWRYFVTTDYQQMIFIE